MFSNEMNVEKCSVQFSVDTSKTMMSNMQVVSKVPEIYTGKVISAVLCSLAHQICVLLAYVALVDASPLHPIFWLKNCFSVLFSIKFLTFMTFITLVTTLQVIFLSKRLTRGPSFSRTRLIALSGTFSVDNIFCFLLNILMGFAIGYMYTIIKPSQEDLSDNEYLFKLLCASFTGAYYFLDDYINSYYFIHGPPISRLPGKSQMKKIVASCIKSSIWPSIKSLCSFTALYYICGGTLSSALVSLQGLDTYKDTGLNSILQLLNVWHLLSSFSLCITTIIVLSTMKAMTATLLSSSWVFPITAPTNGPLLLSEALLMDYVPAVQQLASQDLIMIAETDPERRAELYVLSQPGGHPHNWKGVVKPFLSLVDKMCVDLSLNLAVEAPKPVKAPEEVYFPMSPNIRNMSPLPATPPRTHKEEVASSCTSLSTKASKWFYQQLDFLLKKPPVAFVFGERTEARIAHALTLHGQTVANLVSGISTLAQASYTEDSFGVVQQDLPSLIGAMLKLKGAIDKLGNVFRKANRSGTPLSYLNIKNSLREATVRSIYKIVVVFKPHIEDLPLPSDVKSQLQGFINFKES